jgi:LPS-assembly protein
MGILASILFGVSPGGAQQGFQRAPDMMGEEGPWEIAARTLSYDEAAGIYEAEGDVVISKGGYVLYAQKAVYNVKAEIAELFGGVRFEAEGDIVTGERGFFNLKDRTGQIMDGHIFLHENNFYIRGEVMEKIGEQTYRVTDCEVTTCDGPTPDWAIRASEVEVTVEGYGTLEHATFRIRDAPILYFPYALFPAKTKRQSGLLLPRGGYSSRNGADAELPFFWAISDSMDATFYQRYMSKRGYMQGLEFRYAGEEDSKGNFLYDVLPGDKKDKDLTDTKDVALSPFPRTNDTRYWVRGKADQDLPAGLVLRLDGDYVSDQDYLKEFEVGLFGYEARPDLEKEFGRPVEDRRSPVRTSRLRLSRDKENHSLQGSAGYHQLQAVDEDTKDETAQPLGSLNFGLPIQGVLRLPAYASVASEYDYVWREEGVDGNRLALTPELNLPLWPSPYLLFEPTFRYEYTGQWFEEEGEGTDSQSKTAYEADCKLQTQVERLFDVNWRGATRLKHRIWPSLQYAYRSPQDEDEESPWFEPIDSEGKVNRVRFRVENFLDARLESERGAVSYWQWARFTLTQDYDIGETRRDPLPGEEEEPWQPLVASLVVTPFSSLDLRGDIAYDHYDQEVTSTTLSMDLLVDRAGGRTDEYRADYRYRANGTETLSLLDDVYLTHGFSAGAAVQSDLGIQEDIQTRFWVGYESQCWGVRATVQDEEEATTFWVEFELRGLGEFGGKI